MRLIKYYNFEAFKMEKTTRKKKLGGYPAAGVVVSITLALFVIGLFGLLISYSRQFEHIVRENVIFKVYVKSSLSETQLKQVEQNIINKEFVAKDDKPIHFVPKEEAEKELTDLGDYKEILGDNPFKDMFEVRIDPAFHDTLSLNNVKADLEKIGGVIDAVYEKDLLDEINSSFSKVSFALIIVAAILLIAVILLINNTLKIALFSQRFLIRSMQLVGARRSFIQRPFLFRAALYGTIAGLLASGLLILFTNYFYQKIESLVQLHNQHDFIILLSSIIVAGIIIAMLSTYFSIRKYLKMSLDELY